MAVEHELERLVVRLVGDASNLERTYKRAIGQSNRFEAEQRQLARAEKEVETASRRTESAVRGLGGGLVKAGIAAAGAYVSFQAIKGVVVGGTRWALSLASDLEQATVSFTTMLGSADKAKSLLEDLQKFAATTPFQLSGLQVATKSLLSFGIEQEKILPTLRALGDISSGINIPLNDLAQIFGKARVQGRLFMEDINQLTGRGIPIIGALADQFGVAESAIREMVSKGQVNFGHLERAFFDLTGEGGQFFDMMRAQSQTTAGLMSTFQVHPTKAY